MTQAQVPRFVVTRRLPEGALALLRTVGEVRVSPHERPLHREELWHHVEGADAVLSMVHDPIDASVLDAAGDRLKVVAQSAVRYDNIDVAAATRRGIAVTNTPDVLTDATADLAMGLMLMVTRRLAEGERLLRAEAPWRWDMFMMLGRGLQGKTLGVIGLGRVGQAVARRARAFGMRIIYSQRHRASSAVETELAAARADLDSLLELSDVVSLHCLLTDETRHLIDANRLRLMKHGGFLINTARGGLVDERALVKALRDGTIAGAALDVFEDEPLVHDGLTALRNVVVVPHLGSATLETRAAMALLAARNAAAVVAGAPPLTPVDAMGDFPGLARAQADDGQRPDSVANLLNPELHRT